MHKSRIRRLEERVEALEKALAGKKAGANVQRKRNESDDSGTGSCSSELDWDKGLERIKEANRSGENQS